MGKWVRTMLRRALRSIVTLHGSPEAIALGTAVGMFVAFTPTIGFQMLVAAFMATLLGASRPAAIIPPWITNPVTIPPIFALTHWVGTLFLGGPSAGQVHDRLVAVVAGIGEVRFYAFHQRFLEFLKIGMEVFVPMLIGGVLIGGVCAAITYPLMLRAVRRYRRLLLHRRKSHEEA